ncbi:hypothetical protein BDF22DRAFT_682777 [Syncephalis plumigaleata]|nr:hypothetical protein BDF22DRAFT_682777 [Syncephalis plumigaleata]
MHAFSHLKDKVAHIVGHDTRDSEGGTGGHSTTDNPMNTMNPNQAAATEQQQSSGTGRTVPQSMMQQDTQGLSSGEQQSKGILSGQQTAAGGGHQDMDQSTMNPLRGSSGVQNDDMERQGMMSSSTSRGPQGQSVNQGGTGGSGMGNQYLQGTMDPNTQTGSSSGMMPGMPQGGQPRQ